MKDQNEKTKPLPRNIKGNRRHNTWSVDYDYWSKLTNEEKVWLLVFNDEYYNANPSKDLSPSRRKESFNKANRARRDLMNHCNQTEVSLESLEVLMVENNPPSKAIKK